MVMIELAIYVPCHDMTCLVVRRTGPQGEVVLDKLTGPPDGMTTKAVGDGAWKVVEVLKSEEHAQRAGRTPACEV